MLPPPLPSIVSAISTSLWSPERQLLDRKGHIMLTLPCPFCGQRDETEFQNAGPTKPARPDANVCDAEWIDWLTVPVNPVGYVAEKWWHAKGCGKWFAITRHTVTHEIVTNEPVTGETSRKNGGNP